MPAPTTIDDFLELVRKSGVVDEKRLAAHLDKFRTGEPIPSEPLHLATQLVREGVLTHFQAEQFLQGKWRRFTIGKYKVLERLGAGGMGSVYLCEHMLMRRRVAVKVLPASKADDSSSLERFYREARAVAALDHPNIVRAYDIDQDDNLHFLVMEHVDGSSFQEIIKRIGMMDVLRAAHYMRQAAHGLQHAHETAGLVHRDIKPGNILVDRSGIVKILDMGLARFFHDEEDLLTKKFDENVLGTADYLAPEQALDSHAVDIRADIYSLGATFYFCLTGRTPFAEGSVAQKLIWHQTRAPKPIRSFRPEVPEGLAAVIDRMMAKDASQRYQSPQEVADALGPWTETPIPPPPDNEMPQFSLAATRALTECGGLVTTSRPASDASPPPRKVWQVSGAASQSTATGANTRPVTPSPQREVRPAPPPAPVAPPSPAPVVRAPVPSAPPAPAARKETRSAAPSAAPAVAPAPAANGTANVAIRTSPAAVEKPARQKEETRVTEEPEEEAPFNPATMLASRKGSSRRKPPSVKKSPLLWILIGVATVLVTCAAGVGIYFAVKSEPEKVVAPATREIHVGPQSPRGLAGALQGARAGDRIILDADINESDLSVTKPNITIEGAPGKTILWKCPTRVKPDDRAKLLIIQAAAGVTIKNIALDGDNKTEALMMVYGKCPGVKLENLQLRNSKQFGIAFVHCEGDSDNPVQLLDLNFTTNAGASAVSFIINNSHRMIPQNRFITLRGCKFDGMGMKVTAPKATDVDPATLTLPADIKVENQP